jgi:PAS domain S-box-containing protein
MPLASGEKRPTFLVARVSASSPPPSSLTLPTAPRRQRAFGRILIVDDNTELVATLHAVLVGPTVAAAAQDGDGSGGEAKPSKPVSPRFEVVTASRGEEALAVAHARGFDVAIVDVKLPDISGVDLIRPLRAASPLSEVVLITGFASVDAAFGALRSGAFAFVLKSFRPEELISTVEQALTKVQLKREREELERRYRALVELTDVLVVALDDEDRVVLMNRKTSALAGVPAEAALGQSFWHSWIPKEDHVKARDAIQNSRFGDRAREVETGVVDARDGTKRRVRWHLSRAREEGSAELVYAIGIDVTERRALEMRAADAEAMSAMGALALNLAHEIRNPLNAAVLQLHLLGRNIDKLEADDSTRAALHKRAAIVGDEIGRLNRLLTEFLELARPRGIAREPVHVGRLVDDVLDLERESAAARKIRIERVIPADGCVAIGDREKLKQVIINLVVNAIEAMKEGGTLTARVDCGAERVVIAIEDTGPGIPPDVLANVFDPFFTTKEAGTGLGLSIVRKIVDAHAGEVRIETERGDTKEPSETSETSATSAAGGHGTRVIVTIPTGR